MGPQAQVIHEMKQYHADVLGISVMRWTRCGMLILDGTTVFYCGSTKHKSGVGVLLCHEAARSVLSWEAVSDRVIIVRRNNRFVKVML